MDEKNVECISFAPNQTANLLYSWGLNTGTPDSKVYDIGYLKKKKVTSGSALKYKSFNPIGLLPGSPSPESWVL